MEMALQSKSITIRDVAGFTRSRYEALDGGVHVSMVVATYSITGTAVGFATAEPSRRVSRSFTIAVSCYVRGTAHMSPRPPINRVMIDR
jgi:lipoprotein LpqH